MHGMSLVLSVSASSSHKFSKSVCRTINLIGGQGVEGDAHSGAFVRHRYLARWRPKLPNERQVHLIESELFDDLKKDGFTVGPGELGENITTQGINLGALPLGTRVRIGPGAVVELRGLRTPCVLIDRFQQGLMKALVRKNETLPFRAGVMATVISGGLVMAGDVIEIHFPEGEQQPLPAI